MAPVIVKSTQQVWNDYLSSASASTVSPTLIKKGTDPDVPEFDYYVLSYPGTLGLKYTFDVYGDQPSNGYPLFIALHGGGSGDPREENNWDWKNHATSVYGPNVKKYVQNGVFIAARGLSRPGQQDEWNLHFQSESYFLFQRLIRNLLLQQPLEAPRPALNTAAKTFVDPNRVHILGFSAGGDGVYRLATVLSDRFAAVSVGGGHPGSAVLTNLANVPICIQVGQWDGDEYPAKEAHRNTTTCEVGKKLRVLQTENPGYYTYDIFIHPTSFNSGGTDPRSHSSWVPDHLTTHKKPVIRDWDQPAIWNASSVQNVKRDDLNTLKNTCAVDWVNTKGEKYLGPGQSDKTALLRNPLPTFVSWDVSPRKADEPEPLLPVEWGQYRYSYWLAVKASSVLERAKALALSGITDASLVIRAIYNREQNEIWIQQTPVTLVVLLNDTIVKDFRKPIKIFYGPKSARKLVGQVTVNPDYNIQFQTLSARGDPNFIFSATVVFDPAGTTVRDGGSQIFSVRSNL